MEEEGASEAETDFVRKRRPRQTPEERAAEHADVDEALLRTFGVLEPAHRPDAGPVVALTGAGQQAMPLREHTGPPAPVAVAVLGRDDAPVEAASTALVDDQGAQVDSGTTGADGCAELTAPEPGTYMVVVSAPDHQPGAVAVTVSDGPANVTVPLQRSASIAGTVRAEGAALAGALVVLAQDGEAVEETETAADGGFRIAELLAGAYTLTVTAPGFERAVVPLDVPAGADVHQDVELRPTSAAGAQ